jgi:hypothetical protein
VIQIVNEDLNTLKEILDQYAQPTKEQQLRDFKALQSGKRKFIDESFKDSVEFKDTDQGEITE